MFPAFFLLFFSFIFLTIQYFTELVYYLAISKVQVFLKVLFASIPELEKKKRVAQSCVSFIQSRPCFLPHSVYAVEAGQGGSVPGPRALVGYQHRTQQPAARQGSSCQLLFYPDVPN